MEANGDYIGKTPVTLKIFGDKDGTFHNFGTDDFVKGSLLQKMLGDMIPVDGISAGGWRLQRPARPATAVAGGGLRRAVIKHVEDAAACPALTRRVVPRRG